MNILIFDTDIHRLENLKNLLYGFFNKHDYPNPHITAIDSPDELSFCGSTADIAFLYPEASGINLTTAAQQLYLNNPNTIIFIIASDFELLDDAMSIRAFRYFTTPFDTDRLCKSLRTALSQYYSTNSKIIINEGKNNYIINASDIVFLEKDERKVLIHTMTDDLVSARNMQFWSDTLKDKCFYRCNRAYIINMNYVDSFTTDFVYLSRNKRKEKVYLTLKKFNNFKQTYHMFIQNSAPYA